MQNRVVFAAVAVLVGSLLARPAAAQTFFGRDDNGVPFPNSNAARDRFVALLTNPATETFESFAIGTSNPSLAFGGSGINATTNAPSYSVDSLFSVSGARSLLGRGTATFTFDTSLVGFGLYIRDAGHRHYQRHQLVVRRYGHRFRPNGFLRRRFPRRKRQHAVFRRGQQRRRVQPHHRPVAKSGRWPCPRRHHRCHERHPRAEHVRAACCRSGGFAGNRSTPTPPRLSRATRSLRYRSRPTRGQERFLFFAARGFASAGECRRCREATGAR